jgi:hypothetical protein
VGHIDEFNIDSQRVHEAVGDENAQKGSHQGGGDLLTDLFNGTGDGSHGDDNAQNGGDNAEAGHGIGGLCQHADGALVFIFHGREFDFQKDLEVVGFYFAIDDRTQRVAEEFHGVFVLLKGRILGKNAAGVGLGHMLLQRNHSAASAQHEQFIQRFEQIVVSGPSMRGSFESAQTLLDKSDQHGARRHDHQGTEGGAENDDEFGDVNERLCIAARHYKAAHYRSQNNNRAENDNHEFESTRSG